MPLKSDRQATASLGRGFARAGVYRTCVSRRGLRCQCIVSSSRNPSPLAGTAIQGRPVSVGALHFPRRLSDAASTVTGPDCGRAPRLGSADPGNVARRVARVVEERIAVVDADAVVGTEAHHLR